MSTEGEAMKEPREGQKECEKQRDLGAIGVWTLICHPHDTPCCEFKLVNYFVFEVLAVDTLACV